MNIYKLTFFIALASSNVFANNVSLNKVTVFLQGAELKGQSNVTLIKGENEILLTNIANSVNPHSINVGFSNDANIKILSIGVNNQDPDNNEDSAEMKSLLDKLQQLQNTHDRTAIELSAVDQQIALLKNNRLDQLVKSDHDDLNNMKNVLDFVKTNLVTFLNEQNKLQKELAQTDTQIADIQEKIDNLKNESTNGLTNVINVKVYSDKAITLPVTLSYVINDAGWSPVYDIRVADINSNLQLTYKADIYQNSGLDWQNVDFSLSTSNPKEGITAPKLMPWQIDVFSEKNGPFLASSEKRYNDISTTAVKSLDRLAFESASDNVLIDNLGINTHFNVKLPYTIKSNSYGNILTLQNKEILAQYHYIASPKLSSNVYLEAQISDWDKLNLLPGKSTVFFNGDYLGESFITTKGVKDTLDLSLGHDKNIFISRDRNLNETSKPSFFGDDISQKYAYTIDVKNNKSLPIDIVIYDQLPVILNKIVKLEDAKYDDAIYDKESGLLSWQLKLNPKETKNLNLSFKLTYPKDKVSEISGL